MLKGSALYHLNQFGEARETYQKSFDMFGKCDPSTTAGLGPWLLEMIKVIDEKIEGTFWPTKTGQSLIIS